MIKTKIPPMRLIITSECNGNCKYCHKEGNETHNEMPISIIQECAKIANQLSLPGITLTGGEPTLRKDLAEVIAIIRKEADNIPLTLTTNGFNLSYLISNDLFIDNLNLSITSFKSEIAKKYQNVEPQKVLDNFQKIKANNKNLNVVITEDNYLEIDDFIKYCIETSNSIDFMFELKKYTGFDIEMQKYIIDRLELLGEAYIVLSNTPKLIIKMEAGNTIGVKHPYITSLHRFQMCQECNLKNACFEKICAVRVFPDSTVSPCLNMKSSICTGTLLEKVSKIYDDIKKGNSRFSFIFD